MDDGDYRTISPESVASWISDNGPTDNSGTEVKLGPTSQNNPNTSDDEDDSDDADDSANPEIFEALQLQNRMRAYSRILGVPLPYMNHVQEQQQESCVQEQQQESCHDDQDECVERSDSLSSSSSSVVPQPLPGVHHDSDQISSASYRTFGEDEETDGSAPASEFAEPDLAIDDNYSDDVYDGVAITEVPTTPSIGDRPSSDSDDESDVSFESLPSSSDCKRRRLMKTNSQ